MESRQPMLPQHSIHKRPLDRKCDSKIKWKTRCFNIFTWSNLCYLCSSHRPKDTYIRQNKIATTTTTIAATRKRRKLMEIGALERWLKVWNSDTNSLAIPLDIFSSLSVLTIERGFEIAKIFGMEIFMFVVNVMSLNSKPILYHLKWSHLEKCYWLIKQTTNAFNHLRLHEDWILLEATTITEKKAHHGPEKGEAHILPPWKSLSNKLTQQKWAVEMESARIQKENQCRYYWHAHVHTYVLWPPHSFYHPRFTVHPKQIRKKNSFFCVCTENHLAQRNQIDIAMVCICYWWCYCRCCYWRVTYWLEIMSSSRSLLCMALRHEIHIVCLALPFFRCERPIKPGDTVTAALFQNPF